jgi:hypothetical protein
MLALIDGVELEIRDSLVEIEWVFKLWALVSFVSTGSLGISFYYALIVK